MPLTRRAPVGVARVRRGTADALAPPGGRISAPGHRGAAGRVVCAVDGSAVSRRTVHEAAGLAEALGSRLILAVAEAGRSRFTHMVDVALEGRAELVVVPAPPGPLLGGALLSRRFRDLLRHSPCPVVAVPPQAEAEPATGSHKGRTRDSIVCGVDATEASRVAAKAAADLASRLRLRPIAVHAYEPPGLTKVSPEPIFGPPGSDPLEVHEQQAWALLARSVEALDGPGRARSVGELDGTAAEGRFVLGPPAQALRRIAAREHSRLIVVGSSGAGMLRSMLFGSVSAQLASAATTPVVIVPWAARRWPGGPVPDARAAA